MGYFRQPYALRWRKALFQIHLWTGVIIGLYVIAICGSGCVLVFEQNLLNDRPQLPQSAGHVAPDWDRLTRVAMSANPGSALSFIDMRSTDRRIVPVGLKKGNETLIVFTDSYTNRVITQEILEHKHWLVESALALHTELALGAGGAIADGIGGALLFAMALSGMVLWWPGVRVWKRALRVNWRARWASLSVDVHRVFGFWCFLLVAMWGVTGAYFIFPNAVHHVIGIFSDMTGLQQLPSHWEQKDPVLPVGEFIRRAHSMYPRDELAYAFLDVERPHGVVQVYMSSKPSVPMELLEDEVVFNPGTGVVLMNTSSALWTAGERLSLSVYSVHFGDFGGLLVQILWTLLGLVPLVLVITAYTMWWHRSLKKKWAMLSVRNGPEGGASERSLPDERGTPARPGEPTSG